jgi:hypothetical protein
MSSHERFKEKFLARLNRLGEDGWHVRTSLLAFDYGVPEVQVRKLLVEWAQEGLIWLGADDGASVRPWNQWATAEDMFAAPDESGHIRIRIQPPSEEPAAEAVESTVKHFQAAAS